MMSDKVKISVVVPVYNVERYLSRCVKSIVSQTYSNLEIILVDDGSTDNSGKLCDDFKDTRIKVIHKKNEGLGKARNTGIKYSTGKYIMFVDSDDYIDKTMVANLYNSLRENNADTCIGGFKKVFSNKIEEYKNNYSDQTFCGKEILTEVLVKMFGKNSKNDDHIEMSAWKVLFNSQIIKKYDILFPSEKEFISEDIIFDTEYFPKAHVVTMSDDIGYNYCDNEGSLTTKYNPNRFTLQKKLFLELLKRSRMLQIYDLSHQRIANTFIANTRYCIKQDQNFLSKDVAKEKIALICKDNILKDTLQSYKVDEGIKSDMVNLLMKKQNVNSLYLVMKIKNRFNI